MKFRLLSLVVLGMVLFAPLAFGEEAVETVAPPPVEQESSGEVLATPMEIAETADETPAWLRAIAANHCPFGAPSCWFDDQCDAYCGDPRFGVCGFNGCCLCSG